MEEKKVEKVVPIRQGEKVTSNTAYVRVAEAKKPSSPVVKGIRQSIIWFNIFTASICGILGLINIWTDSSLGNIMDKTFGTFLVLLAVSGFIAVIAPLLDRD